MKETLGVQKIKNKPIVKKSCNTEREGERVRREIEDEEKKVKMIENEFDTSH